MKKYLNVLLVLGLLTTVNSNLEIYAEGSENASLENEVLLNQEQVEEDNNEDNEVLGESSSLDDNSSLEIEENPIKSEDEVTDQQSKKEWTIDYKPKFKPQDKSSRLGDVVTHTLTNLSTSSDEFTFKNYYISHTTEYYFKNTEMIDITIPPITAYDKDGNKLKYVKIHTMIIYPKGRDWIIDPVFLADESYTFSISRQQVLDWANKNNDGEFPKSFYFLVSADNSEEQVTFGEEISEMIFHGDITYRQTLVDEVPYRAQSPFTFFQVTTRIDTTINSVNYSTPEQILSSYVYPETSTVDIDYDESIEYEPGDIVELDITIDNDTKIPNGLKMLLETDALEIIDEDENPLIDWTDSKKGYIASFSDENDAPYVFAPHESYEFTQSFKIREDYSEESLVVVPALTSRYVSFDWDRDEFIEIDLDLDRFSVYFETNGGEDIPALTDVAAGSHIEPVTPVRDGFIFGGWYVESDEENDVRSPYRQWDFDTDTVTADIVLFAKWDRDSSNDIPLTPIEPGKPSSKVPLTPIKPSIKNPDTTELDDAIKNSNQSVLPSTGITSSPTLLIGIVLSFLGIVLIQIKKRNN